MVRTEDALELVQVLSVPMRIGGSDNVTVIGSYPVGGSTVESNVIGGGAGACRSVNELEGKVVLHKSPFRVPCISAVVVSVQRSTVGCCRCHVLADPIFEPANRSLLLWLRTTVRIFPCAL